MKKTTVLARYAPPPFDKHIIPLNMAIIMNEIGLSRG